VWWRGGPIQQAEQPEDRTPDPMLLARPESAVSFDAALAREEIASLRNERTRLLQEVDAAFRLLQDHRRLSMELQESMANNQGASIEVEALAEDVQRWAHRHGVAVRRLDGMERELQAADAREADLERQIEYLQRKLKTLDDSGGND
jgi:chromosome segregation ATPase